MVAARGWGFQAGGQTEQVLTGDYILCFPLSRNLMGLPICGSLHRPVILGLWGEQDVSLCGALVLGMGPLYSISLVVLCS